MIFWLVEIQRISYGIKPMFRHACSRYMETGKRYWCQSASGETQCQYLGKASGSLAHCKAGPVVIDDFFTRRIVNDFSF